MTDPISRIAPPAFPSLGSARGASVSAALPGAPAPDRTEPSGAARQATAREAAVREEAVARAVAEANDRFRAANADLQFRFDVDPRGGLRSVSLLNPLTHEVVAQFPSEDMLALRDKIDALIAANRARGELPSGSLFSGVA